MLSPDASGSESFGSHRKVPCSLLKGIPRESHTFENPKPMAQYGGTCISLQRKEANTILAPLVRILLQQVPNKPCKLQILLVAKYTVQMKIYNGLCWDKEK